MTRALLFDIDHTLLWSGGAGSLAMNAAFSEMFGIDNGFARVEFSGRTDRYIFLEGLRQHGIQGDEEAHLQEFARRYYVLLPAALRRKQGRLMPGFPQLLEVLSGRPDVRLGLATGNFSQGASLKLAYYGIDRFFAAGAFGEESEDRADIVRLARERVADWGAPPGYPGHRRHASRRFIGAGQRHGGGGCGDRPPQRGRPPAVRRSGRVRGLLRLAAGGG